MNRVIFNQKGGVGKTSITCNLAAAVAQTGKKVLVVDLDSQANSSRYLLGEQADRVQQTVTDFFESTLSFKLFKDSLRNAVYQTPYPNLWMIPADKSLTELQPKLESRYKIFKLHQALEELTERMGFDEVLLDTPPALNFFSMSALISADRVLVPFDCDAFSAEGLESVAEIVEEIAADHKPQLEIEGIMINQFLSQAKLPKQAIQNLEARGHRVFRPFLSTSVVMRESHSQSVPLVHLKPNHKLSIEFKGLAETIFQAATTKKSKGTPRRKRPAKSEAKAEI